MSEIFRWSGDGLSTGTLTTSSAGTGDTAPSALGGAGVREVVAAGDRAPRMRFTHTAACYASWDLGSQSASGGRFYFTPSALAPSGNVLYVFRLSNASTTCLQVDFTSTGRFNLRSGTALLEQGPAGMVEPDATYRLEWTLASNGAATLAIFDGDSTTPLVTLSGNTETSTHDTASFGFVAGGSGYTGSIDIDDLLVTDTAEPPGPWVDPNASQGESPFKTWDGAQYVDLDAYVWDGTNYIPVLAH